MIERAIDAYNAGQWADAERLCAEVLAREPAQPDALLISGCIHAQRGDVDGARPLLLRAHAAAPRDLGFLHALAASLSVIGLLEDARRAFEAALAIEPRFAAALHGLGNVMMRQGDRDAAGALFSQALDADPDFAPAIAAMADLALRRNRLDDAEAQATRALAIAPGHGGALLAAAQVAARRLRFEDALALAERALAAQINLNQRAHAFGLKGEVLEALSRFDEAFAAFSEANAIDRRLNAWRFDGVVTASSPETVARLTRFLQSADAEHWPKPNAGDDPVFLVGFPRSGTTLMGQVLAAHPEAETLEEHENLSDALAALLLPDGALDRWRSLSAAELDGFRAAYWRRVAEAMGGRAPTRRVLIDKMPMNMIALPLIQLLFPNARIVFVARDPRDVVMSCFKQRFAMNSATWRFLALDTAVAYCDAVMQLAATARARLPLRMHVVHYEDLVDDFEPTVRKLLTFLDLPWSEAVRDHPAVARESRILTPSAYATTQPLYGSAVGAWRRYEAHLAPYRHVLDRWRRTLREGLAS